MEWVKTRRFCVCNKANHFCIRPKNFSKPLQCTNSLERMNAEAITFNLNEYVIHEFDPYFWAFIVVFVLFMALLCYTVWQCIREKKKKPTYDALDNDSNKSTASFIRQQPSSNEECISANCKKITGLLIVPLIVLVFDAFTFYNFSSISNTTLQVYAVFHMVKALILIILCALFVYAVYHPVKRDIFWVGAIITGLLFIIGLACCIFISSQCDSMGKCKECPNYNPSISKQCNNSLVFPIFGLIASFFVPLAAFIGYLSLGR